MASPSCHMIILFKDPLPRLADYLSSHCIYIDFPPSHDTWHLDLTEHGCRYVQFNKCVLIHTHELHFIVKHGGSHEQGTQASIDSVFCEQKGKYWITNT